MYRNALSHSVQISRACVFTQLDVLGFKVRKQTAEGVQTGHHNWCLTTHNMASVIDADSLCFLQKKKKSNRQHFSTNRCFLYIYIYIFLTLNPCCTWVIVLPASAYSHRQETPCQVDGFNTITPVQIQGEASNDTVLVFRPSSVRFNLISNGKCSCNQRAARQRY